VETGRISPTGARGRPSSSEDARSNLPSAARSEVRSRQRMRSQPRALDRPEANDNGTARREVQRPQLVSMPVTRRVPRLTTVQRQHMGVRKHHEFLDGVVAAGVARRGTGCPRSGTTLNLFSGKNPAWAAVPAPRAAPRASAWSAVGLRKAARRGQTEQLCRIEPGFRSGEGGSIEGKRTRHAGQIVRRAVAASRSAAHRR
jgi:hypothetical protein